MDGAAVVAFASGLMILTPQVGLSRVHGDIGRSLDSTPGFLHELSRLLAVVSHAWFGL